MSREIEALARELGGLLRQHELKLVTAESCTGGGLGFYLTTIAGSSDYFDRGFITYSNAAKIEMLEVNPDTLEKFGAVSEETAREMAEGALKHSDADLSVSITGVAGPDGGSEDKPVGTVWMAYARKNLATRAEVKIFMGDRAQVREATIKKVFEQLIGSLVASQL